MRRLLPALLLGAATTAGAQQPAGDADTLMREGYRQSQTHTPESLSAALGDFQQALRHWQTPADETKAVGALSAIASVYFYQKDLPACRKTLEEGLALARGAADAGGQALLLASLGLLDDAEGQERAARDAAAASATLYESVHLPGEAAQSAFLEGKYLEKLRDNTAALQAYERSLAWSRAAQREEQVALVELTMAPLEYVLHSPDAWRRSVAQLLDAAAFFSAHGKPVLQALSQERLGDAYDALDDHDKGRDAYAEALAVRMRGSIPERQGRLAAQVGLQEKKLQRWPEAAQHFAQALVLLHNPGEKEDRYLAGYGLGSVRESAGDLEGAATAWTAVANESQLLGDDGHEAVAWLSLSALRANRHQPAEALAAAHRGVAATQRAAARGDSTAPNIAFALILEASAYQSVGQIKASLDDNLQALPGLAGDQETEVLIAIAMNHAWLHQNAPALQALNEALPRCGPRSTLRAQALAEFAEVHNAMGDHQAALREASEARRLYHDLGVSGGEATAWNTLGMTEEALGRRQRAEAAFHEALASARRRNLASQQVAPLENLGELEGYYGDYRKAQALHEQALRIAQDVGDSYLESSVLSQLGMTYHALGQEARSKDALQRALDIHSRLDDPVGESIVLADFGVVLAESGEPQRALDARRAALDRLAGADVPQEQATALNNLGASYKSLGEYAAAEDYFERSLALRRTLGADSDEGVVLNNLASLNMERALAQGIAPEEKARRVRKAAELLRSVTALLEANGEKNELAIALSNRAAVEREQQRFGAARAHVAAALRLARATHAIGIEAGARFVSGTIEAHQMHWDAALPPYRRALALWRQAGSPEYAAEALYAMAKAERALDHSQAALTDVRAATRLKDGLRGQLHSDDQRAAFLATGENFHELEVDLLMRLAATHPGRGYEAQALEANERGRARSLLDLLDESHAAIGRGADPALLEQESALVRALFTKDTERRKLLLLAGTAGEVARLNQEIVELTEQYETVDGTVRAQSPRYAALTQTTPVTLATIQSEVLDEDTVLLEYALGEERSYLWIVGKGSLDAYTLAARKPIEDDAAVFLQRVHDTDDATDVARSLSARLLEAARAQLKGRLVIVADGALQAIPFALLPQPGDASRLLLDDHEVVMEPSASSLAIVRRNAADRVDPLKQIAVIADPVFEADDVRLAGVATTAIPASGAPGASAASALVETRGDFRRLPHSGAEAAAILALTKPEDSMALTGFAANKDAVLHAPLADYRIVHFATHGVVNRENAALSGLMLSMFDAHGTATDGFLTLNDIYNWSLPVNLVVLSACNTAGGRAVRGEGIIGLTRGFLFAGAQSLVVSLWQVDDASTAELIRRFYARLLEGVALRPAAALRAAQLSMRDDAHWGAPYFWAAFTVQGDWR